MNRRQKRNRWASTGHLALVLSALLWGSSQAQPEDNAERTRWYQIEVVVFERLPTEQSGDIEVWPKDIELGFPADWQKLIDRDTASEWLHELVLGEDNVLAAETLETKAVLEISGEEEAEPRSLLTEPRPPLLVGGRPELAYVQLPAADRTLNESTAAIDRHRAMRVLFHEAWRQPLDASADAPAIIVQGGNRYGDHTELEGSLGFSISRYLHLHTNLWLTQFIPNYGQEPEHWPPLPSVPKRQQQPLLDLQQNDDLFSLQDDESVWELSAPVADDYNHLIEQPYLTEQIVTLKQNRRMRSGELHYIDHPRIGLLVKVDTYEPEPDDGEAR